MYQQQGPLLTDKDFFVRCIDANYSGLDRIKSAALHKDYGECRALFADFVRGALDARRFFSCLPKEGDSFEEDVSRKAELAMKHIMTACKIPHDFGGGSVDWFSNPTYNGYPEWTWQLSRHAELLTLARAYRIFGDERYAVECCALFDSWVKQATRFSVDGNKSEALCWRSIECGIRMSVVWPEMIHSVIQSEACSDDMITDFFKSIYEHAVLLRNFHKNRGNWLIMEMSGLLHIATLYPFFAEREEWFAYAESKLKEELQKQVYPDGFQFELSTGYQQILVTHYSRVIKLLRGYGKSVPEEFGGTLKKILDIYVKLMRPNGCLPDLNDGTLVSARSRILPYIDLLLDDPTMMWVASDGKVGAPPADTSFVLPNSGIAVFRTGWGREDTWLCFDGGPFGVAHQHEDKLNLLMHASGKYILTEGNNYAYDSSEMRKYVLSTRAHNTVLVDGMEQNRRKSRNWSDEMICQHSGLQAKLSDTVDACRASYEDGYGEDQDKTVRHERSVYFVKKLNGLPPFALVVDRLTAASGIHLYEIQYHLDAEKVTAEGLNVTADGLQIIAPKQDECGAALSIDHGVKEPKWNGWTADSVVQGDFRPIYIVKYVLSGNNLRFVTLLLPIDGGKDLIRDVEAGTEISDTKMVLKLKNNEELAFDENDWLERI